MVKQKGQSHSPRFSKDIDADTHFKNLREAVNDRLKTLPSSRLNIAVFKAFLLPAIYLGIYISALYQTGYFFFCLAYVFLGFMLVILFLNLVHESCHHVLFKNKKSNQLFMLLFDLIGANSYMWQKRHVRLHHNYTNVEGWDSDIEKSKFLQVHPQDDKKIKHHYQHLLIWLYPLFITNWFLVRDFKDFFSRKMIVRKISDPTLREYIKLFGFKLFFIGYLVVLPAWITPFAWWQCALALFIMLVSAGFFALLVLLPPHVNTSNQFPVADKNLRLSQSWLMHQLNTTNDVRNTNWFTRHVMANFNFHIAHHLFPNIPYVYAKEVTDVIASYCSQAGLPYRSYPIGYTLVNHYRLIKRNARVAEFMEEDL